jgi:branched-chain amino acid transport system permease protein
MILLGVLAVVGMMRYPQGLWGLIAERWDLRVFPVQRRVAFGDAPTTPSPPA